MERVTGLEPVTSTLARLRSSQLSYTRTPINLIAKEIYPNPARISIFFRRVDMNACPGSQ